MPEVICNTSPIQYLHQTDLLQVLEELYGQITIPERVVAELDAGRAMGIDLPVVTSLSWVNVKRVRGAKLLGIVTSLGPGEKEVLALGLETPGALVILDDLQARRYSSYLGLKFTGTLGVLLKAKQGGRLSAIAPILDLLEALQFRLDPETRKATLQLAKEMS